MRSTFTELLLLSGPALLMLCLAELFGWSATLAMPLVALAAFLPAYRRLRRTRLLHGEQMSRYRAFTQRLIDVIPQPVYVKDAQARYLMVNKSLAHRLQQTPEALIGQTSYSLLNDESIREFTRQEDASVLAGDNVSNELRDTDPLTGKVRYRMIMKGSCLNAEGEQVIVGANFDLTPWREAEQALQEALLREQAQQRELQAFLQRLIDVIPYPIYVKDTESRYQMVNQAFLTDKQRSAKDLIGQTGLPASRAERLQQVYQEDRAVLAGQSVHKEEQRTHARTGKEIFRIVAKGLCHNNLGEPIIVGAHIDITELRQAERHLQEALQREVTLRKRTEDFVQRLIDVIPDPVYVKSAESRYLLVNEAFAEYHQLDRDFILSPAYPPFGPTTPRRNQSAREDQAVLAGQEVLKEERVLRKATGEEVFRIVRKRRSIFFDGSPVIIGIDHNVTRWRLAERELQHLAQEDALTGLANRRHFQSEAERAIDLAQRYQEPLSLIMLDLDHFKQINDQYGHYCGDRVLIEAVLRIKDGLRRADFPCRWGGEEFLILLPHTAIDEARQVAERLRKALADQPLNIDGRELQVTLSAGLAQRQIGEGLDSFIARADAALYAAKHSGRNTVHSESL